MPTLPVHISKRMVAVYGHVENALKLLEAFASKFEVQLYRDGTGKHEYIHDFTLMLAIDDLSSLSLTLFDSHGNPQAEHVVDMRIDDNRGESPLLNFFKSSVQEDAATSGPDADLPQLAHGAFSYSPQGKGLIDDYRPFFSINWMTSEADGSPEPVTTTKSNCGDIVPVPPKPPSRAIAKQNPQAITKQNARQLSANRAALPNYAD